MLHTTDTAHDKESESLTSGFYEGLRKNKAEAEDLLRKAELLCAMCRDYAPALARTKAVNGKPIPILKNANRGH